jgi:hypothetical protein
VSDTCEVKDGRFVIPCGGLDELVVGPAAFSRARGVHVWDYYDMTTRVRSRTFFGIKTKEHPDGMLFNFCPICGTDISAPFMTDEAPAA